MSGIRVVFRADASLTMGSGHVMRCLTLADALRARGASCRFVCREHPGNLLTLIRARGFEAVALPLPSPVGGASAPNGRPAAEPTPPHGAAHAPTDHAAWIGAPWQQDAKETAAALGEHGADWVIVDHYGLDGRWEEVVKPHSRRLLAIDDLANRPHACDLLLDQTLGREAAAYTSRVPQHCELLLGSSYALLRPEFAQARAAALQRRRVAEPRRLLILMGGVDVDNVSGKLLRQLAAEPPPGITRVDVVLGPQTPHLQAIWDLAARLPLDTHVHVDIRNVAALMTACDLAIGAAGSASWERCCLGLPTVMLVLADNQRLVAQKLQRAGAALLYDPERLGGADLYELLGGLCTDSELRLRMVEHAAALVDGLGAERVVAQMAARDGQC